MDLNVRGKTEVQKFFGFSGFLFFENICAGFIYFYFYTQNSQCSSFKFIVKSAVSVHLKLLLSIYSVIVFIDFVRLLHDNA